MRSGRGAVLVTCGRCGFEAAVDDTGVSGAGCPRCGDRAVDVTDLETLPDPLEVRWIPAARLLDGGPRVVVTSCGYHRGKPALNAALRALALAVANDPPAVDESTVAFRRFAVSPPPPKDLVDVTVELDATRWVPPSVRGRRRR